MREKCGYVLLSLCAMIQEIPDVSDNDSFQDALDNSLKTYAFCCGNLHGIYCDLVRSLLVTYNVQGYQYLNDLIFGTKNSTIMKEIFQFERDKKILALIEQNDKLNRTEIARLLGHVIHPNRWTEEISADIELVHNGIQNWEWFYNKHHNDRDTFGLHFPNSLIREVYEYFNSDAYKLADNM